ncbi:tRNA-specific adenosine deaminase [Maioricimonas rarisocia]|uniref:tRNA-specific adenosine deaminase n=1 Tax=Maioricimonas rarisocia TaxID=2528026 RepID=A0A517ZC86_9PLAN|nr:nucleoside deaminase [Maioricimonas rarisocia]QDU40061.1 tRNA-specific adenosine deaminase [Maioricimonas rarisocia]
MIAHDNRHDAFMREAIGAAGHNPLQPFGSVIVDRRLESVVATGANRAYENPIWHGEIVALNTWASLESRPDAEHLSLFTTAEPCPMCQAAILWAGISEVVFGTSVETLAGLGWKQFNVKSEDICQLAPFAECQITGGVLEAECDELFQAAARHRDPNQPQ